MADGVDIDTDGVADFGKDLHKDASGGFQTAATRGAQLHSYGVEWGTKMSAGPIGDARQKLAEALANTEANLRVYPQAAGVLASVAEEIARDFAGADLSSKTNQDKIDNLLAGALLKAQTLMEQTQASVPGTVNGGDLS